MDFGLHELSVREQRRLAIVALSHSKIDRQQIVRFIEVHEDTVKRWENKNAIEFTIWDQPHPGRERTYSIETEDRFIAFYCQTNPFENVGRWSLRWAEHFLKMNENHVGASPSRSTMHRMLNRHHLKPHKNRYFLQITDPNFFPKMDHLIALYQNPPEYLFCFDECPGIQILKRLTPDLRPDDKGGMLKWVNEFEYIRNGTTDLFAFLDVNTGTVQAHFHADHKKITFIQEFHRHVALYPEKATLNYIMDNLASHSSYEFCQIVAELSSVECPSENELKTVEQRRQWLQNDSKRIIIHFTPFHGSWLNMVEIVFRLVGEKVLQENYSCPDELHKAAEKYFKEWNENWAHPFTWKYDGTDLHQKVVQRFTSILNHSTDEITLQYLTKSSLLMINMIENYWQEVPLNVWIKFFEVVHDKSTLLYEIIEASTQVKVSKKAKIALDQLLIKITDINSTKMVA